MHMESPPDYEDDQVSTIEGHGTYMETHRVPSDGYPITALAFDPIEELLWVGTGNGRLSALAQPGMQKHVSVRAHPLLSPVRQIRCFGEGVISISGRQVQMHNKNCLALCAAPASAMLEVDERGQEGDIKSVNSRPKGGGHGRPALGKKEEDENVTGTIRTGQEEFTCGALNVPPGHHHHPMAAYVGEHMTVGGSGTHVWELDLATGLHVVRTLEVASPSTCMESNRAMVIGGADGRLRFLDGSLRSGQAVERDLEAFTGPVTSLCTWNDMVAATGTQGRSLNPYDRSGRAPTRLLPDPLIKLFDLRMLRQSLPLSFAPALVAPSLLTLLPHTPQSRLVVGAATTGQFLLCDPFNVTAADTAFFQVQNHHTGGPSPIACVAASPSGEMLASGTPDGLVISYTNSAEVVVNRPPVPLEILPSTPPPPPDLHRPQ
ncbi:hypothetical protein NSK_004712 [Nannochloropsis salina CCMP1776]|uniref:PAN2-PAN3 deadenylation complex catalytic subunit PAN2 N-terminal domain-containing protein n=1 Tax=Nannochloropsis salina CCMP1776 TaxID=1027361 RepID=A0A4D9CZK4_9STRA|nr:hypothetical protein NSK_004712 [Nannochloropsis salina CCMP1776]|eukprot:TFJ83607.1 hypothetical protein NSK_004712 [Nannochloropsis salina CCMP1776]